MYDSIEQVLFLHYQKVKKIKWNIDIKDLLRTYYVITLFLDTGNISMKWTQVGPPPKSFALWVCKNHTGLSSGSWFMDCGVGSWGQSVVYWKDIRVVCKEDLCGVCSTGHWAKERSVPPNAFSGQTASTFPPFMYQSLTKHLLHIKTCVRGFRDPLLASPVWLELRHWVLSLLASTDVQMLKREAGKWSQSQRCLPVAHWEENPHSDDLIPSSEPSCSWMVWINAHIPQEKPLWPLIVFVGKLLFLVKGGQIVWKMNSRKLPSSP